MDITKINEIVDSEIARPPIPKPLHDIISDMSEKSHVKQLRLYAEILSSGLPSIMKKYNYQLEGN
jgi:hypothetical protein